MIIRFKSATKQIAAAGVGALFWTALTVGHALAAIGTSM